jgi:phosphoenolpyruvate carboxykinase (GTP)
MEQRVHGEVGCVRTPTGLIPRFEDLQRLFKDVLGKDYSPEDYLKQFTIRVQENLAKLDRVEKFHRELGDAPAEVFAVLADQRQRLLEAQGQFGNMISPDRLPQEEWASLAKGPGLK